MVLLNNSTMIFQAALLCRPCCEVLSTGRVVSDACSGDGFKAVILVLLQFVVQWRELLWVSHQGLQRNTLPVLEPILVSHSFLETQARCCDNLDSITAPHYCTF